MMKTAMDPVQRRRHSRSSQCLIKGTIHSIVLSIRIIALQLVYS